MIKKQHRILLKQELQTQYFVSDGLSGLSYKVVDFHTTYKSKQLHILSGQPGSLLVSTLSNCNKGFLEGLRNQYREGFLEFRSN